MRTYIIITFLNVINLYLIATLTVPKYETKYTNVSLDHFNFLTNATFKLRYLVNTTFWKGDGPIFFYTGGEGEITLFAENTGFMWEIAPQFQAMLVFAEHRYYGESKPMNRTSPDDKKYFGYLSSSQALADYVAVIKAIRTEYNASHRVKVITFGGSYSGMLAAWMRMKYPAVITGALASSAPIWQFSGLTSCDSLFKITSSVFAQSVPGCDQFIKKSWDVLNSVGSTDEGRAKISSLIKSCNQIQTDADMAMFKLWLSAIYHNLAMVNYPYPANFFADLPAYPVQAVCNAFERNQELSDEDFLRSLFKGISIYTNGSGTEQCINMVQSNKIDEEVWEFQGCTELVSPQCNDGVSDMFEKSEWNITEVSDGCFAAYQVRPNENLVADLYGGKNIAWASNLIFSNGLIDPWSGGGVTYDVSENIVAVLIPGAAHHLDLRFSNPADPPNIVEVRKYYNEIMERWLEAPSHEEINISWWSYFVSKILSMF